VGPGLPQGAGFYSDPAPFPGLSESESCQPPILIHKILCRPTIQVVSSALVSTSSTALERPSVVDPFIDTHHHLLIEPSFTRQNGHLYFYLSANCPIRARALAAPVSKEDPQMPQASSRTKRYVITA